MKIARDRNGEPLLGRAHRGVHAVQFYETDAFLLEVLAAYVGGAFAGGESALVIATSAHREGLEKKLSARGFDVAAAQTFGTYVALDAAELISNLFIDGSLSHDRFAQLVGGAVVAARGDGKSRPVRAFGEMVALLWELGDTRGALDLEEAWDELSGRMGFALICAYPVSAFSTEDRASGNFQRVIGAHASADEISGRRELNF